TMGTLQPVFTGNATSVNAAFTANSVFGLAFSPFDFNLWHVTDSDTTPPAPGLAPPPGAGHGINATFNASRGPAGRRPSYPFNFHITGNTNGIAASVNQPGTNAVASNPGIYGTYNVPGGAFGSLVSNKFSLEGYSQQDRPTLYFTYFLDTDNTGGQSN